MRCSASTTRPSSACTCEGAQPAAERKFASHHHEDDISSIGISDPRPLDPAKLNQWLDYLLKTRGQDIFRMKGVLNVKGEDRRQVFHGVHMMFDAQAERPWGPSPRINNLVFIGRGLDRAELEAGFESAVAKCKHMPAKQSLSFALEPRAVAVVRRLRRRLRLVADGRLLAIAGGEGKVGLATLAGDFALRTIGEHLLGTLARGLAAARAALRDLRAGWRDRAVGCGDGARNSSAGSPRWPPTQALAYSPGGELLASAAGKAVSLWTPDGRKAACLCAGRQHRGGAGLRQARNRYRGCPEW